MKLSCDPTMDAPYIRFIEEAVECEVIRLNDRVAINIGPEVLSFVEFPIWRTKVEASSEAHSGPNEYDHEY